MAKFSPMMEQYFETKKQYQDCILFYRLGDFYEMFFDDAKIASRELELTLTGRNCGQEERAPMCGVPFHAADTYIARLVERGYKVAICEQMEDPALAKGLVKRDVIRVVTPGTLTAGTMLKENENNYICSVFFADKDNELGICYSDISTGELYLTEFHGEDVYQTLLNELVKIKPSELIVSESFTEKFDLDEIKLLTDVFTDVIPDNTYNESSFKDLILTQFNTISLMSLGIDGNTACIMALGALLSYLFETQKQDLRAITHINHYEIGTHMTLDKATIRNLEITETLYDKTVKGSLLGILDKCQTAMGSRRLRQWLREPLNDSKEINRRLDGVEELYNEIFMRNNIKENLKEIYDFQRLMGRIAYGNANGKDLIALKNSLRVLPDIKYELDNASSDILQEIDSKIHDFDMIHERIEKAISEDAGFTLKDGGLIKPGYSKELDDLKFSIKDGKEWISSLEQKERERTGIKTIKVGYNKVFGYYIEVSKSFQDQVPEEYIRKQTLVNGERFITPELKEMENLVLNAEAKINDLEYRLFVEIREFIQVYIKEIQETSEAISDLDVLLSYAQVSEKLDYVKPVIDDSLEINIVKGRHPVIEQTVTNGLFVSNDTYVNNTDQSMLLITGPNMAGKSTYMRQTALIVLMAQAGCFVPAESARIGVCDRIFTRIGASDNLAQGQSTFFVEMSELSYILNNAGERSLIILDEIGRGTSTYDGLSIAWAAVEELCNEKTHIRTLFATHYHELTVLEDEIKGVKNLNVDVAEEGGTVVFLHKIVEGSASRSYGIQVARLAGIPEDLLERAEDKLNELEEQGAQHKQTHTDKEVKYEIKKDTKPLKAAEDMQMSFFDLTPDPIIQRLRELDLMEVTPSEAIKILEELKRKL
ncbi:MAG: DNA mismatch repair protein MutS [Firmicutes bacterium]|nr:DNA mismatch repair protein MutS [Bacillota bacterium]